MRADTELTLLTGSWSPPLTSPSSNVAEYMANNKTLALILGLSLRYYYISQLIAGVTYFSLKLLKSGLTHYDHSTIY